MRLFNAYRRDYVAPKFTDDFDYPRALLAKMNQMIDVTKEGDVVDEADLLEMLHVVRSYYFRLKQEDIFEKTEALLFKKTQDYNAERVKDEDFKLDDKRTEYFPFGDESYLHMIYTKVYRVHNIASTGHTANFEGIEDSLIDCAAYLSFYYSHMLEE